MQPLNTIPVENYLNKVRIASKSHQKVVNLPIDEAEQLAASLTVIMTRLSGELDAIINQLQQQTPQEEVVQVQMDGGSF
jgi:hypothetical protein